MSQAEITPISALVLCADQQVLSAAARALEDFGVLKDQYGTSGSAAKGAVRSRFELCILDLDPLGADNVLDLVQAGNRSAVVIALSRHAETLQAAVRKGIHFAWKKPVSEDLILRDIKAACGMARLGRRPDHRIPVNIRVYINVYGQRTPPSLGTVINLSASGVCLKASQDFRKGTTVSLTFQLPEEKATVHAMGKVIWCDQALQIGVHFNFVPAAEGEKLRRWVAERTPSETELLDRNIASQVQAELQAEGCSPLPMLQGCNPTAHII